MTTLRKNVDYSKARKGKASKIEHDAEMMAATPNKVPSAAEVLSLAGTNAANVTAYKPLTHSTTEALSEVNRLQPELLHHSLKGDGLISKLGRLAGDYVHWLMNDRDDKKVPNISAVYRENNETKLRVDIKAVTKAFKDALKIGGDSIVKEGKGGTPTVSLGWLQQNLTAAIKGGFLLQAGYAGTRLAWFKGRDRLTVNAEGLTEAQLRDCYQAIAAPYNNVVRKIRLATGAQVDNPSHDLIKLDISNINSLFWEMTNPNGTKLTDSGKIPQETAADDASKAKKLQDNMKAAMGTDPAKMPMPQSLLILEAVKAFLASPEWRKAAAKNDAVLKALSDIQTLAIECFDDEGNLLMIRTSPEEQQQDKVAAAIAERNAANA